LKSVCIIQARMGSSRLLGKVMLPLGERNALAWVIARCAASSAFDAMVVATTTEARDDPLAAFAQQLGAQVVRGNEQDVLSRYALAAQKSEADIVTRITSDCPLIDPDVIAVMMARFRASRFPIDIMTNGRVRTFPRGLDTEIMTRAALEIAAREAIAPAHREHVTLFLYANPGRFRIVDHTQEPDLSSERWTLDTAEDYALLKNIFSTSEDPLRLRQPNVLAILNAHPDWRALNAHIEQKKQ
jgi:spore coat polysaccharide biosynthesis protein SpsF